MRVFLFSLRNSGKGVKMVKPYKFHGKEKQMDRRNYRRAVQKERILELFRDRIKDGNKKPLSHYKIARGLNMRPSTHLHWIIKEMVADGTLQQFSAPKNGRFNRHVYMIPKGQYEEPKKRCLTIRAKGMVIDQWELI